MPGVRKQLAAVALAVAAVGALGCPSPSPEGDSAVAVDSSASDSTLASGSPAWYSKGRALDLTGDGTVDSVHLDARGARTDSLRITLALVVGGEVKHREAWGSSYELAMRDSALLVQPRLDEFVRARLDTVLASVVVQPLSAPSVRLMAEDSAILAGLTPRPDVRISIPYGYETVVRLVWDAPRERFVRLWSCC